MGPIPTYVSSPQSTTSATTYSALTFLVYIVATAVIIVLLIKYVKLDILLVLMEGFVVFISTTFLLFILMATAFPNASILYIIAIPAIVSIALIVAKNLRPKLRNLVAMTSSIGVGVIIGQNGFIFAYILMLFIAVYDYIAVFVTKHMLTLAKAASSNNLALLIGSSDIEAIPKSYVTAKDRAEFKKSVNMNDVKDPVLRDLIAKGAIPVMSQALLGTGDLAIPLMLTVSAYITFHNNLIAVIMILGGICGLVFTMNLLKTYKVALPAIPPLSAFINFSLAVAFLLVNTQVSWLWPLFLLIAIVTLAVLMRKLKQINRQTPTKGL